MGNQKTTKEKVEEMRAEEKIEQDCRRFQLTPHELLIHLVIKEGKLKKKIEFYHLMIFLMIPTIIYYILR